MISSHPHLATAHASPPNRFAPMNRGSELDNERFLPEPREDHLSAVGRIANNEMPAPANSISPSPCYFHFHFSRLLRPNPMGFWPHALVANLWRLRVFKHQMLLEYRFAI